MARLDTLDEKPKAFSDEGVQFAWDSTSVKLAEECLYKYKLSMLDGWQPRTTSVHLRFGAVYATALEHYHKHRALGLSHDDATRVVTLEALIDTWTHDRDEQGERIAGTGKAEEFMDTAKTRETLLRTIIWYLDHFEHDPTKTIILGDGTPAVEYTFVLPVDNGIILTGHIDRFVEYAGYPYVQDQKTTKATITPRYFEGYSPDTQMSQYSFAGRMITGNPVKGVIIDAAQIAVGFTRFERGFAMRSDDQLDEWYDHTMYHIEVAQTATREQYFPMNRSSCGNYGGCPFRAVCSRVPRMRDVFLKGDFEKKPRWDPLKSR